MSELMGADDGDGHKDEIAKLDREAWKYRVDEITELPCDIFDELERIYGKNWLKYWTKMRDEFIGGLLAAGIDRQQIRALASHHVLVGGTPVYEENPVFDLPGDLSIAKFMRVTLAKLKEQGDGNSL